LESLLATRCTREPLCCLAQRQPSLQHPRGRATSSTSPSFRTKDCGQWMWL